ncbi:hypothetical protein OPQ81_010256 [Rhizoctonia solani]|nr:hypothetical protein OPQ81_010256 [Rhizoctonia solani]
MPRDCFVAFRRRARILLTSHDFTFDPKLPYMMSTPSGTEPTPASDPGAHLAGAKALLAKKLAQKENPAMVSSPTDNMMTPATAKINAVKKKHFMKGRPISGPKFGTALATSSTPQKLEDGEEIADSESDIHKTTEP